MNADQLKGMYGRVCQQTITARRYSGTPRTPTDASCRGHARFYNSKELVGTIMQNDQEVIVLADDIAAGGIVLPLTTSDKLMVDGRELAIMSPNPRKALDGTVIAYACQARG